MKADGILLKPDILSEDFVPKELHGRKEQVDQLRRCLAPALKQRKPINALLFGPSGSGKTAAIKTVAPSLRQVAFTNVNCRERNTLFAILNVIASKLEIPGAERIDTAYKIMAIEDHLRGSPAVFVRDEVDKLQPKERNNAIYRLASIAKTALVCISEDKYFLHSLEETVRSRFHPALIEFFPYSRSELSTILLDRCSSALLAKAIGESGIDFIVSHSAGNARIALEILRKAASFAEQDRALQILSNHLELASAASDGHKEYLLGKLNRHYSFIYELVKKTPGIISAQLWISYKESCRNAKLEPIAERTFSLYLKRMTLLSLISAERAEGRGNIWKYRTI